GEQAATDPRQRALSRGVGPDHADHLAGADRERGAGDSFGCARGVPEMQVAGLEQERHRRLRRSITNSGAPMMAVTAPTGGSAPRPRKRTRASASARTRKAAPPRAEAGRTTRWSGPVTSRTAWGTTNPTKPTSPV